MPFKQIRSLFKKFDSLRPPNEFLKTKIIVLIEEEIGILLKKEDISVAREIVYIKANQALKNEIFLKKEFFLEKLNEQGKPSLVKDIR